MGLFDFGQRAAAMPFYANFQERMRTRPGWYFWLVAIAIALLFVVALALAVVLGVAAALVFAVLSVVYRIKAAVGRLFGGRGADSSAPQPDAEGRVNVTVVRTRMDDPS